ncbi:hypothetical protein BTN50_0409 [Candidatus Enterovibrio altilux]|uniref:Uncharacterized protein n=1 Tax=Candidatus Enterovibrio altilux TaxID=1927128 RepID=A0A291B7H4_9GAMM|nr:hypothetical protein BTN50_0409 [Candidatus Enterovibrio luxaltus]
MSKLGNISPPGPFNALNPAAIILCLVMPTTNYNLHYI